MWKVARKIIFKLFFRGGYSWDLVVSTPARAEKTLSALQGASRFGHQAGARQCPSSTHEAPR
jgi:hypothetical protein